MAATRLSPIYQNWPQDWSGQIRRGVSHCANIAILDETEILRLCCDASNKIHQSLGLHEGDLPFPFIADHCWERWTRFIRKPSTELHLPFIFLDTNEVPVPARLIFHEIRHQACTGSLYPGREMRGVLTDAEWDGAIEAALYHAEQNGFPIPRTSDLRWRVVLDQTPTAYKSSKLTPHRITGRSAGVTFLLAVFHFFGKVAEWNTRQSFESIIALAALPTRDQAAKALIHLGGDESKKALALHGLGHDSGSQHLHVILAGSFAGFQNVELPPSVEITHAETVAQLKSAIQEIIRRERMSALEKPQALDFDDYLQLKRKGFVGREWLFEEIDRWSSKATEPALLITGDPGSGKSSIMAELIHRNPGARVIGYHFCQSNEIETLRPGRFVQSLAAMIASHLPAYAELLNGEHLTRVLGDERCEKDPGGAFLEGVLQPLQKVPPPDDGVRYILVDALDEASGFTGQRTLPDILASHILRFPSWLRLVATTRNEPKVMQSLSGLRAKQIDASDPRNQKDLITYLYQRLSEPSLAERLVASHTKADAAVEHISRKSSGNFLYAVQVLDGIARDEYSFANLDALPRGLDGIYLDFFRRIFGNENTGTGEAAYQKAKPLLQILCTALEPLTRAELAAASQLDPEEELPQLLRKLTQLLTRQMRATGEETLAFHHKSVPDWLTTHLDSNAFAVGPTKGRKRLAEFCRDSLAAGRAKSGWYVRRHAVEHFLKVADWDSATEALCDLEFIEARAIAQELPAMLMDYAQAAKLLPEGEKERQTEAARQAELDRYAGEMYEYAAAWSRIRDGREEKEPSLPRPVKSVRLWTEEEIAAERKRMTEAPNRLDRVKAFRVFVASNTKPLQQHATQEGFVANIARNDAPAGPVHEEGKTRLEPLKCIKLIKQFSVEEIYNPLPGCSAIFEGHTGSTNVVSLSADARYALSADSDGILRMWDLKSGECLKVLVGHTNTIFSVALSVDGCRAVSAGSDKTLRVWDLASGVCLKVLDGHTNAIFSVALSPDGCRAVSGSLDGTLRVWDLASGVCLKVLHGHTDWVGEVALSADGRRAVSVNSDRTLRVWDLTSGVCLKVLHGHTGTIESVAMSADGRRAVSCDEKGTLRVWDIDLGVCLKAIQGHTDSINTVTMSADGYRAVSCGYDSTLHVWDLNRAECIKVLEVPTYLARSVALSNDGSLAVLPSHNKALSLWDLESGDCRKLRKGIVNHIGDFAVNAEFRHAASLGWDSALRVWNLESGKCVKIFKAHDHMTQAVSLSADGQRAISTSYKNTLRLLDLDSGRCLKSLQGHTDFITTISMSDDGHLAISASHDRTLRVWDLKSGVCIKVLQGHTGCITMVALSNDGHLAISASHDKTLRVWDLKSAVCLKVLHGHTDVVGDVALSSDGRRAVSTSHDNTLRVWDLESGKNLKVFKGPGTVVHSVYLSADDRNALLKHHDTLSVLDLNSGACYAHFFCRGLVHAAIHPALQKIAVILLYQARPVLFDLKNISLSPLITTAHREIISEDLPAGPVTARPPCCDQLISIPADLAERIEHWHLAGDERGDYAYTDPGLLLNCISCGTPLRMNPFFLDVKPLSA